MTPHQQHAESVKYGPRTCHIVHLEGEVFALFDRSYVLLRIGSLQTFEAILRNPPIREPRAKSPHLPDVGEIEF